MYFFNIADLAHFLELCFYFYFTISIAQLLNIFIKSIIILGGRVPTTPVH